METQRLKAALDPWMRLETWHTFHPLDEQRFHRALQRRLRSLARPPMHWSLRPPCEELAREHHGEVTQDQLEIIDECAQLGEAISLYLYNTRKSARQGAD